MFIYLLTHEREISKKSNTGKLVVKVAPDHSKVVVWKRKEPCIELLKEIETGRVALLYPSIDSKPVEEMADIDSYILLDGTWQEAQKMYNKSPYLKTLPKANISTEKISRYHMRRNQKQQGLCTAECAIEVLKHNKEQVLAKKLTDSFELFLGL